MPVDGASLGVVLRLEVIESFKSLEAIPEECSFPLEELVQLVLLICSLIFEQICHIFLLLSMV